MKFKYGLTEQEKNEITRKTILRHAKALHNACKDAYKLNNCNGCNFKVNHGCKLYDQPITWAGRFI